MLYDNWGQLVSEKFPPRDRVAAQRGWEVLKQKLAVGQSVAGTVIAKAPFGAWLDIGVGFPALLLIPDVEGLTPERYRADDWCPIGSILTAVVVIFNEREHQIRVSQGKL